MHRRAAAPWCVGRRRTRLRPARRVCGPTPPHPVREYWPIFPPYPGWSHRCRHTDCRRPSGHPNRRWIELGHPQIDSVAKLGSRQPHPLHAMASKRGIQLSQHVRFDILGARDDGRDHAEIDRPSGEHRRHFGQLVPQHPRMVDLAGRPPPADVLRRRDFGGHFLDVGRQSRRSASSRARRAPARLPLPSPGNRHRLGSRGVAHSVDQPRIADLPRTYVRLPKAPRTLILDCEPTQPRDTGLNGGIATWEARHANAVATSRNRQRVRRRTRPKSQTGHCIAVRSRR